MLDTNDSYLRARLHSKSLSSHTPAAGKEHVIFLETSYPAARPGCILELSAWLDE